MASPISREAALINPMGVPSRAFRDFSGVLHYARNSGLDCQDCTTFSDTVKNRAESLNRALGIRSVLLLPASGNRYDGGVLRRIDNDALLVSKPAIITFSAGSTLLPIIDKASSRLSYYGPHLRFVQADAESDDEMRQACSEHFWQAAHGNQDDAEVTINNVLPGSRLGSMIPEVYEGDDNRESVVLGDVLPYFLQSLQYLAETGYVQTVEGKIVLVESDNTSFSDALTSLNAIHKAIDLRKAAALCVTAITPHHKGDPKDEELYSRDKASEFVTSVRDMLGYELPVTYGFPMGHGPYKYTVPFNHPASFNYATNTLSYVLPRDERIPDDN